MKALKVAALAVVTLVLAAPRRPGVEKPCPRVGHGFCLGRRFAHRYEVSAGRVSIHREITSDSFGGNEVRVKSARRPHAALRVWPATRPIPAPEQSLGPKGGESVFRQKRKRALQTGASMYFHRLIEPLHLR